MNALANSQEEELEKFIGNVAGRAPVTFARYTGQEDNEERQRISQNPPDILLTNFMMLELLMTRQDDLDRRVIGNCAGVRFLVLDELHTYRGRQGADVALLVRRVRERLAPDRMQCIGTSATMASEGSLEDSGLDPFKRKILGFLDNRQDAALQSGHFNDFLFVSLIRAGFLGALQTAGPNGLRSEELGLAQQRALGFDRPGVEVRTEWLQEPDLRGFNLQDAETTLRQVLAYRVWFDQRRGWRYTNPNLEQLQLVKVDYEGLDALAADEELFAHSPEVLRRASPVVRTVDRNLIF